MASKKTRPMPWWTPKSVTHAAYLQTKTWVTKNTIFGDTWFWRASISLSKLFFPFGFQYRVFKLSFLVDVTADTQKEMGISAEYPASSTEKTATKDTSTNTTLYYLRLTLRRDERWTTIIDTESTFVLSRTWCSSQCNCTSCNCQACLHVTAGFHQVVSD